MAFRIHQSEIRVALSPSVVRSVLIGLLLFNVGCHDDLKAEIEGVYRIDMSRVSAELSADKNMMQAQRWTFKLGQRMLQPVRYGIKDGACWRGVAGARKKLDCRFTRIDKKKVVVYRSEDDVGRMQFLRASRTADGIDLEIDGRILPLLRIPTDGSP